MFEDQSSLSSNSRPKYLYVWTISMPTPSMDIGCRWGLSLRKSTTIFLGLGGVELQIVRPAPSHKVPVQAPVLLFLSIPYTPNNGRVIKELLHVTHVRAVFKVCGVQGEQDWGEHCSLWGSYAANHSLRGAVPQPDILRPSSKVIWGGGGGGLFEFSLFSL